MLKPAIISALEKQRDAELAARKEKRRQQAEERQAAAASQEPAGASKQVRGLYE